MLKRLYDWTIKLAGGPRAVWALAAVSFAESSFFPIPPDIMLIPMGLAQPKKIWFYAFVCSVASVVGGLLGYFIGAVLFDSVGMWILTFFNLADGAETFKEQYAIYGHWVILFKGVTPIPFKLITITSGAAGYNLAWFVGLSIVTRSARFFLVAALMHFFGPHIAAQLDKHLTKVMIVLVVAIIGGFVAFKYIL
ncbi:MAG: DedA family protein [Methylobacteriaceae bacterium]|nr:DedA family protein [Methylobacteriaceae bacterium]